MEMNNNPTQFPELNTILRQFAERVQPILQDNFLSLMLTGSFALGDADEHSDVDFAVVTRHDLDEQAFAAISAMHEELYALDSEWAKHLEGSYMPLEPLRDYKDRTYKMWYLDNGATKLERSLHDNTLVQRWEMREKGVRLVGMEPTELLPAIAPVDLRREVYEMMQTWADDLFANPQTVNNGWYQMFAVLSYCRMLQTLETAVITSKKAAVTWAKATLDPQWHGLINRSWAERPDPWRIWEIKTPGDFELTLEFIRYALSVRDDMLPDGANLA